jgi:uncharacterized protein (DUF983 family)
MPAVDIVRPERMAVPAPMGVAVITAPVIAAFVIAATVMVVPVIAATVMVVAVMTPAVVIAILVLLREGRSGQQRHKPGSRQH